MLRELLGSFLTSMCYVRSQCYVTKMALTGDTMNIFIFGCRTWRTCEVEASSCNTLTRMTPFCLAEFCFRVKRALAGFRAVNVNSCRTAFHGRCRCRHDSLVRMRMKSKMSELRTTWENECR